jgi:hypothetical protein
MHFFSPTSKAVALRSELRRAGSVALIVVPDYKKHRIEINARSVDGRWMRMCGFGGRYRIRNRTSTRLRASSCPGHLAEKSAETWARRWVDLNAKAG